MKAESHIIESLPIGGGGYVTGMVIHPLDSTIKYIRTDVGGAYRWNEKEDKWDSITDFFGWNQRFLCGVDGIAIDPNNKDIVYMCCGDGGNLDSGGYPALYKSEDRGHTFQRTSLEVTFFGNANSYRTDGECIMVDPNNSNVVYVGSRTKGFFRSSDGAKTFDRNYDLPVNGNMNAGQRGVVIDGAEKVNGRSKIVYVSVPGNKDYNGVYVSLDGGDTFSLIEGSPKTVHRMALPIDRRLYVSCDDGVLVYDGEKWKDISPLTDTVAFHAMAVCQNEPNKIIACHQHHAKKCMNMDIFYSEDGGESWEQKNSNMEKLDKVPWWPGYYFSSATCHLLFDPNDSNRVYFTDWYGVWTTDDIKSEKTYWRLKVKGHEEAVVFDIKTVPEGDIELLTGMADNGGMYYRSLSEYPERRRDHQFCYIDFAENEYNKIIMCGSNNSGNNGGIYVSEDYGVTYKINENWGYAPAMRIAVSSDNSNNWVIVSNNKDVMYTLDGGETFHYSENAPKNLINAFWFSPFPLCSDRVKSGTFYIACKEGFFRSDDGGVSFKNVCPELKESTYPAVSPKTAGLVFALKGGKINRSYNFGDSFEEIEGPYDVRSITFGRGIDDDADPVLYFLGKLDGKEGAFASEDMGKTFVRLNTDENKLGKGNFISGDRRCYGRFFIGTGGRGILIGHL